MPASSSLQDTALDHLRVIRTLMERASIYRAVSAPAALAGGFLSLAVALFDTGFEKRRFLLSWLTVLALTSLFNFILLSRDARRDGRPMITDALRMALRAIVPPMLTGGILGGCLIWFNEQPELAALVWILCYGLALQATASFAPRSIIHLARAFLVTGQALTIVLASGGWLEKFTSRGSPSLLLGLTFGLFHIVYAIAVFLSPKPAPEPATEDAGVLN